MGWRKRGLTVDDKQRSRLMRAGAQRKLARLRDSLGLSQWRSISRKAKQDRDTAADRPAPTAKG